MALGGISNKDQVCNEVLKAANLPCHTEHLKQDLRHILRHQFGKLYQVEFLVDIEYDEAKFRDLTELSAEQIWRFSDGFSLEIAEKIATMNYSLVHSFFKMDTTYDRTKFAISSFLRLTQQHSVLFACAKKKLHLLQERILFQSAYCLSACNFSIHNF